MKGRWRRRKIEREERGSESHWGLVGLKKKRGGGCMETGNQLLGFASAAARWNLEVCEREKEREMESKASG